MKSSDITLDAHGRVVLTDSQLADLEASFVPTAGGSTNGACRNFEDCTDSSNVGCLNDGDCTGSKNPYGCHGDSQGPIGP